MTPAQREIFFVRDGMNTNMNTDFQNAKKSIIGRVSQAIWDKYYLNEGNEARILTAYSTRDPRLMQTIFAPSTTTLCYANTGGKQSAKTVRWPFLEMEMLLVTTGLMHVTIVITLIESLW